MPIVLIDRRAPKVLTFGDATITIYEAAGDVVLSTVRRHYADAAVVAPDSVNTARPVVQLAARHVSAWSGVLGADGAEIPWPDAGAADAPGCARPSAEALKVREELLAALPWDVIFRLEAAMVRNWAEGSESGKG